MGSITTVIETEGTPSELQRTLAKVAEGQHLDMVEAGRAFQIIMLGGATPAQISALLMGLRINRETVPEIAGAAMALRAKATKFAVPDALKPALLDTCGTGGDRKGTYNISTAVAFVAAGCGVPVAKHGNVAVSSRSGSADVLKHLGVNIEAEEASMRAALLQANICFLMAPRFHGAMKNVAPIRRELAMRTIFNLLGPLINPASPERQLLGVYSKELTHPLAEVLRELGSKRAWVVHGSDGMDELTIHGESYIASLEENGTVQEFVLNPAALGINPPADPNALKGGDATVNAQAMRYILQGHGKEDDHKLRPYRDIVLLNAGAALLVAGKAGDLKQGMALAAAAIEKGMAMKALEKLVEVTNG